VPRAELAVALTISGRPGGVTFLSFRTKRCIIRHKSRLVTMTQDVIATMAPGPPTLTWTLDRLRGSKTQSRTTSRNYLIVMAPFLDDPVIVPAPVPDAHDSVHMPQSVNDSDQTDSIVCATIIAEMTRIPAAMVFNTPSIKKAQAIDVSH
jgi:hypothetical protein